METPEREGSAKPPLPPTERGDEDLDDLTRGLVSLDINQSTSSPNPNPASVPVGGARQKVRPSPQKSPMAEEKVKAVPATPEILKTAPDVKSEARVRSAMNVTVMGVVTTTCF